MRKAQIAIGSALAAVMLVGSADPALAKIKFAKIQYESPGVDTGSNASLNAEYAVIKNTGHKAVQLKGYQMTDLGTPGARFVFGKYRLKPHHVVKVHTGKGRRSRNNLYFGRSDYFWHDDTDAGYLANRNGRRIDTCAYVSHTTETSPPAPC